MGEIVLIVIVALLVVGPDKLPEAARSLGKGIRDLRRQTKGFQETIDETEIGDAVRELRAALRGDPELRAALRGDPELRAALRGEDYVPGTAPNPGSEDYISESAAPSEGEETSSPATGGTKSALPGATVENYATPSGSGTGPSGGDAVRSAPPPSSELPGGGDSAGADEPLVKRAPGAIQRSARAPGDSDDHG